ncbi:aldo/keto reductase [Paenibacillus sp. 19GGS1-52]|uniref:aldo/keto reductase n=1 Tax=Paenibacillus sp. 19GGS1-52 TaxID=2758563 RepID=UPI001EFA77F2|nr:aldo/keto reductase [Paenibacillus sp. 19GGS1-52]ULO08354.1 aldo/keto reductase [Paenibacillus sp. 19GGS1-52]
MKYRPLGTTGLDVSVLSFGASSLGSVFRDINEEEGIRTVHTAVEQGINYIDVSPYYGLTKAETVLGKAIKGLSRDQFLLSTKAGRIGAEEFNYTAAHITASLEASLKRLETDYVDILLLHDMEFVPFEQVIEEAIPALYRLKEQGKARFVGVSGLPLHVFEHTLAKADLDVILSYCHYSLNDTSLLHILPLLQEKGVGLVSASPISMGLLSTRPVADWHPAPEELKRVCKLAAAHCAAKGEDLAKLAVQFSVANEQIPTTLVSTGSVVNITNNIAWTDEPMNEELLQEVLEILQPIHNLTWPSGRTEYNL